MLGEVDAAQEVATINLILTRQRKPIILAAAGGLGNVDLAREGRRQGGFLEEREEVRGLAREHDVSRHLIRLWKETPAASVVRG